MTIAYLRVSTTRQRPENQREEISRYAEFKGIKIDRWITDIIGGKTDRHKRNLGKVLKSLKKGDTLIITEISRLSRSLHEIMVIMKYCVDNSISIYSTKDGYTFDDSINSKILSFAFGLAAELEHKLISQRTKEAMALLKAQGKQIGRKKGSGEKMKTLCENKQKIINLLMTKEPLSEICKQFGVSYRTFYRFRDENPDVVTLFDNRS
jgi:DNA invertase Pin-like site-specific DNA recombinase